MWLKANSFLFFYGSNIIYKVTYSVPFVDIYFEIIYNYILTVL